MSFTCNAFLPCTGHVQVEVLTIVVSKVLVAVQDMCTNTSHIYIQVYVSMSTRRSSVLSATVTGAVSNEVQHWKFTCVCCKVIWSRKIATIKRKWHKYAFANTHIQACMYIHRWALANTRLYKRTSKVLPNGFTASKRINLSAWFSCFTHTCTTFMVFALSLLCMCVCACMSQCVALTWNVDQF